MRPLEQVWDDVKRSSKDDQAALLDRLTNVLEDELELTDEFTAEIEQGKADIAVGRGRIVRPFSDNRFS